MLDCRDFYWGAGIACIQQKIITIMPESPITIQGYHLATSALWCQRMQCGVLVKFE